MKIKYSKKNLIFALFLSGIAGLFGFQNCARVSLESSVEASTYAVPALNLKTTICPKIISSAPGSTKFLFIVDMSLSNIGSWDVDLLPDGSPGPNYFNKTTATDFGGQRFDSVKYFLTNCAQQAGLQFQVIGFSNDAGIVSGSGNSASYGCSGIEFTSAATAAATVEKLRSIQTSETQFYMQYTRENNRYLDNQTPPPIMTRTSYTTALTCANSILANDLTKASSASTEAYDVFLISDGTPKDKANTGCEVASVTDKDQCYIDKAVNQTSQMRVGGLAKDKDLRIYGIYYGSSTVTPKAMDAVAKDGGTASGIKLDSFSGNQDAFCSLVVSEISVSYEADVMQSINMTSYRRNGVVIVDSDMDGVPDSEEAALGMDPTNPRSVVPGVLDGICVRLGGVAACQAKKSQITCSATTINGFGVSDCDFKILGLDKVLTTDSDWGVDTDLDTIPDIVEIIRGTDPGKADASSDPDNDGISNLNEIAQGSDPFSKDDFIPNFLLNNSSVSYIKSEPTCGDRPATVIESTRLQASQTLNVPIASSIAPSMSHPANQNVILHYYRMTPQNSASPNAEFYGGYLKVDYNKTKNSITTVSPNNRNLPFIGKVSP